MQVMAMVIIALCAVVGTYLYVMALCYLCDVYERKKRKKLHAQEKRRQEKLRRAADEAEMRRKQELERRKQLAEARRQQGHRGTQQASQKPAQRGAASATH